MNFFSALLFLFFSVNAFGDIVFFDINNSPQEIEAARKAAVKRGEKLIVYPKIEPSLRAKIDRQVDQLRAIERRYSRATNESDQLRLTNEYNELSRQMEQSSRDLKVDKNKAAEFIDQLAKDKVKVSSIVISGHDGNGDFTGTNGSLLSRDLMSAFQKYPELSGQVKSLFLAGCYTTKPGTLDHEWKPAFPNLEIINGYISSAPLGDRPAGHEFIYNALSREKEMLSSKSPAEILASARSIIPSALGINASICLKDGLFVDRAKYLNLEEAYKKCDILLERRQEVSESFKCYAEAKEGCEDPPENTQSGPLREYYNLIQGAEYCGYNPKYEGLVGELPSGARMIRLMYYKNLRKNFANIYKEDLATSVPPLKKAGLSDEDAEKLLRIGSLSRKEAIELVQKIEALGRAEPPEDDKEKGIALFTAHKIGQTLRNYLLTLSDECVPFNWVEPSSREPSQCENRLSMGAKAEAQARKNYDTHVVEKRALRIERMADAYRSETKDLRPSSSSVYDPVTSKEALDEKLIDGRLAVFHFEAERVYEELRLARAERGVAYYEEQLRDPRLRADSQMRSRIERDLEESRRVQEYLSSQSILPLPFSEEFVTQTSSRASILALREDPERYFRLVSEALVLDQRRVKGLEQDLKYLERETELDNLRMVLGEISEEERTSRLRRREAAAQLSRDSLKNSQLMVEFVEASRRALASGNQDEAAKAKVQEIIAQGAERATRERVQSLERSLMYIGENIDVTQSLLNDLSRESPRRAEYQRQLNLQIEERNELQRQLNQVQQPIGSGGPG